jgi:hypothetical protein
LICPLNGANCGGESATIDNINFAVPGSTEGVDTGTITTHATGEYPTSAIANQLINIIATSMQNAATGNNCQNARYSQGCGPSKREASLGGGGGGGGGNGGASSTCVYKSNEGRTAPGDIGAQIWLALDGSWSSGGSIHMTAAFSSNVQPFDCGNIISNVQSAVAGFGTNSQDDDGKKGGDEGGEGSGKSGGEKSGDDEGSGMSLADLLGDVNASCTAIGDLVSFFSEIG